MEVRGKRTRSRTKPPSLSFAATLVGLQFHPDDRLLRQAVRRASVKLMTRGFDFVEAGKIVFIFESIDRSKDRRCIAQQCNRTPTLQTPNQSGGFVAA